MAQLLADHAGKLLVPPKPNGDLRQWGLTQDSTFDAIYAKRKAMLKWMRLARSTLHSGSFLTRHYTIPSHQVNLKIGLVPVKDAALKIPAEVR